jgi:hypothetical protein
VNIFLESPQAYSQALLNIVISVFPSQINHKLPSSSLPHLFSNLFLLLPEPLHGLSMIILGPSVSLCLLSRLPAKVIHLLPQQVPVSF